MKYTLGFSPCPNDTFIFDALVNKKIDTEGFDFDVQLEDVQTLNEWALRGMLDFSKISYGVYPLIKEGYHLLQSGGALGKGVGPLLISKSPVNDLHKAIETGSIAIPGKNTTAHFLFMQAFPNAANKKFMVFYEIEEAVLCGKVDAGVIIHENRFTYQQKGLLKLIDLGEYWEQTTGYPIPLGGIVAHHRINKSTQKKVDGLIRKSVEYAFANYPFVSEYVKQHSQEMSEEVMRMHIDLYVNNYSLNLGDDGMKAVECLMQIASTRM
ncbi:MAG: 1,4-dihydroxy-6-naphthoate synthase [Chitinophagaceae bacterium]|jgi:1,4-dihydroxy-6-naphthoate synthase|nr:1,4-dihydroxy-6-naphthoate synthase [Chitinophagaceae bacterium]